MICDKCLQKLNEEHFKINSIQLIDKKNKQLDCLSLKLKNIKQLEIDLTIESNKRRTAEIKNIILISVLSIQFVFSFVCFITNF